MNRRAFLKRSAVALTGLGTGFRLPVVEASDHDGKLLVFIQAAGAWDPTSFCDPKMNTPGERVINHWAETDETRLAGNVPYAPFAANQAFFEKYYDRTLVINGVDAQTNSHTVVVVHNWSGRNSEGYPGTTALMASQVPSQPLPYINYGGYAETGGLTRYTRLDNPDLLQSVAYPRGEGDGNDDDPEGMTFFNADNWASIENYRLDAIGRLASEANLLPGDQQRIGHFQSALASGEALKRFADAIPPQDQLEQPVSVNLNGDTYWSQLRRQVQLTVLAFATEASTSADLILGGFDTHSDNDPGQNWLFGNLTDAVDYLWDYAEQNGVADRLFVVIGSDFGRTNFYNSDDGKDHWPIGSFVIMEKNQTWTNRAVGETDALHFAQKINPTTLARDDNGGTIIYPKHVHKAIRSYLDLDSTTGAARFPFNNTEDFAFFG